MKPAQFELSADTRFLRQKLAEVKAGDTISYAALSEAVGKPVDGAFSALQSARRKMEKEGFVFSPIRGVGLIRLDDAGVIDAADSDIAAMRRKARRSGVKLSTVSYDALPDGKKLAFTAKASIVGAIAAIATNKAVAKLEKAAGGRSGELPITETLKALGYSV